MQEAWQPLSLVAFGWQFVYKKSTLGREQQCHLPLGGGGRMQWQLKLHSYSGGCMGCCVVPSTLDLLRTTEAKGEEGVIYCPLFPT
jgi:hypothetical protein